MISSNFIVENQIMVKPQRDKIFLYCVFLFLLWEASFLISIFSPTDLLDMDQERPAAYVLDAYRNGNWLCQRDNTGDITSKPPMFTWLAALTGKAMGGVGLFALYLPGALSVLAIMLTIFFAARKFYGDEAGLIGAFAFLVSSAGIKYITLVRTDGLFAATVFASAIALFYSFQNKKWLLLYWILTAAATLTKGPLCILLSFLGIVPFFKYKEKLKSTFLNAHFFLGLTLFFLIAGSWFILAYLEMKNSLVEKMISKELVGHAMTSGKGYFPGTRIYVPPFYFLSRFFPWSVFAVIGFWRIVMNPQGDDKTRFFEKFLFSYFICGLIVFSLAPHQRIDHLAPLLPAACILAGKILYSFRIVNKSRMISLLTVVYIGFASVWISYNHNIKAETNVSLNCRNLQMISDTVKNKGIWHVPFIYCDVPYAYQFFFGTMNIEASPEIALEALNSDHAAYVITGKLALVEKFKYKSKKPLYDIFSFVVKTKQKFFIISNVPNFNDGKSKITYWDGVLINFDSGIFKGAIKKKLVFDSYGGKMMVEFKNVSKTQKDFSAEFILEKQKIKMSFSLKPGETQGFSF